MKCQRHVVLIAVLTLVIGLCLTSGASGRQKVVALTFDGGPS